MPHGQHILSAARRASTGARSSTAPTRTPRAHTGNRNHDDVALPDNVHALSAARPHRQALQRQETRRPAHLPTRAALVRCLTLLPDGLRFVSGSGDSTALVYHRLAPQCRANPASHVSRLHHLTATAPVESLKAAANSHRARHSSNPASSSSRFRFFPMKTPRSKSALTSRPADARRRGTPQHEVLMPPLWSRTRRSHSLRHREHALHNGRCLVARWLQQPAEIRTSLARARRLGALALDPHRRHRRRRRCRRRGGQRPPARRRA